jgi:hypothetical protein
MDEANLPRPRSRNRGSVGRRKLKLLLPRLRGRRSRIEWDDKYAREGWDYQTFGTPDVLEMEISDDDAKKLLAGDGQGLRARYTGAGEVES